MTPHDLLVKILDAIEYNGDKEAFAALFMHLTYRQAILNLVQKLTADNRDKLTHELSVNAGDPIRLSNEVTKVLSIYYNDQQKEEMLESVAQKAVVEWMQAIVPMLTDAQKQKLVAVFSQ